MKRYKENYHNAHSFLKELLKRKMRSFNYSKSDLQITLKNFIKINLISHSNQDKKSNLNKANNKIKDKKRPESQMKSTQITFTRKERNMKQNVKKD